ncbi:cation-translocating P-type ATPase [Rhodobacter sp. Har01]|uniref:cation-translocating P-type ATPase n=1 Tax=Rhodobacter sp. Har01 TaxID=2883999 RepID=UPI001D07EE26|nr:cation-translocating P-type ATPase [Rhodobacter sp. Har01]MCB6180138.1 cation-translocating P-type ATPase [Rhodobacter sp. Har01]
MTDPATSLPVGLTQAEAKARLAAEGPNELPKARRRSPLRIILDVLREPMLALLLAGGVVYLLLGNREEALILLAFAGLSVGITVVQEARTERVLEALRDLTSPRALVIRDGQRQRIAGRDVARGDVIVLAEGDRVPADAALMTAADLSADESLLTGEAVPVRKVAGAETEAGPGGEDQPMVYSGSLIVRGTGMACVTATGTASEIGRIGTSLGQLETETPHLQRQMRKLVIVFAAVGAAVSAAVVVLYGLLRGGWLEGVLAGIAVGMSMLPEEFPMVLAVFMAMGAWRISKVRVLTRRASAIETLGAASVLCTDKTGTLTENRMTIAELRLPDGTAAKTGEALPEAFRELAAAGVMASAPEPFDPMEKAFHVLSKADLRSGETLPGEGRKLVRSYPLSSALLAMSQAWEAGKGWQIAAKGAPEAVAVLCRLDQATRATLTAQVDQMAGAGLRVLGVAEASQQGSLPEDPRVFRFQFLGLVGLADPLRASVPDAVAQCRSAGIRVIMITGDYPATAQAIAGEAGLQGDRVITGPDLASLSDAELATAVKDVTIFARIMPEQKLRIVSALKAAGAVVAMTGDGVNDAPSLKAAHIGIAMGGRGTDVAREAASIVLLDDDFGSIVTTVRLGRRIYDNLRKAMSFILAVHVPIAGLALMPLLFGMPILFGPMHIAFLEMVIDPVCSLVFEAETEEDDVMTRKPRPPTEPLFSGPTIVWSLVQGALVLGVTATIFTLAPGYGLTTDQVRGMTFAALVFAIVALILVDRSRSSSILTAITRPNRALAVVLPIVGALLAVTLFWQPARDLFGFAALDPVHLAVAPLAGLTVLVVLEVIKPIWRWSVQGTKAAMASTSGKRAVH